MIFIVEDLIYAMRCSKLTKIQFNQTYQYKDKQSAKPNKVKLKCSYLGGLDMQTSTFRTETISFRRLFDNGVFYTVPKFQSDYSCSLKLLDELWSDAILAVESDEMHYQGIVLLKEYDTKNIEVLFDQQKFTALTLLILSVIKNLKRLVDSHDGSEQNLVRINQIWNSFISNLDPVSLKERYKLCLNKHDNDYFFNKLVYPLREQKNIRKADNDLYKSFLWFDNKVSALLQEVNSEKGQFLASFVESLSDSFVFTVMTINDDNDAFNVLNTINTSDSSKAVTDLLKNYLLSKVEGQSSDLNELSILEKKWNFMVNRLQDDNFLDYVRAYWNSKYNYIRASELLITVKNELKNSSVVATFIDGLASELDNYLDLILPNESSYDERNKSNLNILKKLKVKQAYALLLCAKRKLSANDFSKLLTQIVCVSFRFESFCLDSLWDFEKDCAFIVSQLNSGKHQKIDDAICYLVQRYIINSRL